MNYVFVICAVVMTVSLVVLIGNMIVLILALRGKMNLDALNKQIGIYVRAAEQQLPGAGRGLEKLDYVETLLEEENGIKITGEIGAMIEAKVYEMGEW